VAAAIFRRFSFGIGETRVPRLAMKDAVLVVATYGRQEATRASARIVSEHNDVECSERDAAESGC